MKEESTIQYNAGRNLNICITLQCADKMNSKNSHSKLLVAYIKFEIKKHNRLIILKEEPLQCMGN